MRVIPAVRRDFLESLYGDPSTRDIGAVGVKIMYEQISLIPKLAYLVPPIGAFFNDTALLRWLSRNQTVIIHTLRRNHLKMIISHAKAAQTGLFHHRTANTATAHDVRIVLPVRSLIARLHRIESAEKAARKAISDFEVTEVWYEDYIGQQRYQIEARLCAALGQTLPSGGLQSSLLKTSSDDLREVVANYEQIVSRLKGTRFERFLS
jgi:LPS sulfotransferase NodH